MEQIGFKIVELYALLGIMSCIFLVILFGVLFWLLGDFKKKFKIWRDEFSGITAKEVERIKVLSSQSRVDLCREFELCKTRTFEEIKNIREEFEKKLHDIFEKLGLDAKEIRGILDSWKELEKRVDHIETMVNLKDVEE